MKKTKLALFQSMIALLLCFSMLIGTSFAWFTDSVTTGTNIIQSGNLDVKMYWADDLTTGVWYDAEDASAGVPFDYDLWEPGYTEVRYVKIVNAGNLALKYQLTLAPAGAVGKLAEVIDVYYAEDVSQNVADRTLAGMEELGALKDTINGGKTADGALLPGNETVVALALKMDEQAGNEYQNKSIGDGFVLKLLATQQTHESDDFGDDYDAEAKFPSFEGDYSASSDVELNEDNTLKNAVTLTSENGEISATVPAGTLMEPGVETITLTVSSMEESGSNIEASEDQVMNSVDVHISGVSAENQTAISVTVKELMVPGLNIGNYQLYHVESGVTNEMKLTDTPVQHNDFSYDPATGDVTMALKSFSEVALLADTEAVWGGEVATFSGGTGSAEDPYIIANADQLAYMSQAVSNDTDETNFAEAHYKLIADVNFGGENQVFYPIGYWAEQEGTNSAGETYYGYGNAFSGTFDGNGHTVSNIYQNTWAMDGSYDNGYWNHAMGLFGYVYGGTVKNLTVDSFSSDGEFTPTGCIAAYAAGDAIFENIAITNCNPRVYNTGNGGIIGIAGSTGTDDDDHITLTNITVDNSNKISALWGSWDVACGGLVGMYRGNVDGSGNATRDTITFTNCHVAAQIDVNNDVCANYQYYAYRYAGMIIGSVRHNTTNADGKTIPNMTGISASGCTVNYGDWNDYYYCEFEKNSMASYSEDYQFSRVPHSELNFTDSNGNGVVDADERDSVTGCKHEHTAEENHQAVYLPFHQLFTGYGWGVNSIGLEKYSGIVTNLDIIEGDQNESVKKFTANSNIPEIKDGTTVNVGDLFTAVENPTVPIDGDNVQVFVSPLNSESTVSVNYEINTDDWTKGILTFSGSGSAEVIITDYYYCVQTKLTISIETADKFAVKLPNVKTYLYRVGNANEVFVGSLFMQNADYTGTINSASVEISVTDLLTGDSMDVVTKNTTTWTNGSLNFGTDYTGVVKVTISGDNATAVDLYLEVVDAKNYTSTTASGSTNTNIVLLNDVKISSGATAHYDNSVVYGNGFTFDVCGGLTKYVSSQGWGVINLKNGAVLDNLVIVGDVYDEFGVYSSDTYNTAAVFTAGGTIQNCHISHCAAPVIVGGTSTIEDTTLYGGSVANMIIKGGTATLENVITVNNNTIPNRDLVGLGVVVHPEAADGAKLVINGEFKQYNFYSETDKPSNDYAHKVYEAMFGVSKYCFGTSPNRYVNSGIISMTDTFNGDDISGTWKDTSQYTGQAVVMNNVTGYVYTQPNTVGSVDNGYDESADTHKATVQGDYLPTFSFNLGDQEISYDGDTDSRYLYGDASGVKALYQDGDDAITLDISKLATVYKYTGTSYTASAVCRDSSGNTLTATNGVVTFSAAGEYTLVFTVKDNIFYGADGNAITKSVQRTYTVPLSLSVKEASIPNAKIEITQSELLGYYYRSGYSWDYNYGLRLDFLACVKVTDYSSPTDTGSVVDLTQNIGTATLSMTNSQATSAWDCGFVITINYTNGQVLTVTFSDLEGDAPGNPKTLTLVTNDGVYFKSDNDLNNLPASNYKNTCSITKITYKGNNGATVENTNTVSVKWNTNDVRKDDSCVAGDTLVTLADGSQKRIDEVTYDDQLLVWNFFTGEYDVVPSAIIYYHGDKNWSVLNLNFEDGTTVKVINNHGFFDMEQNEFVFITEENVEDYIGHSFAKVDGENRTAVKLVSYSITEEYTGCYSIETAQHKNFMVEGMFSLTIPYYEGWFDYFEIGENMKYDEEKMQADIEKYGLYTYEDFAEYDVTYEQFVAFNGPYLKVLVGRGTVTFDQIIFLIDTVLHGN